VATENKNLSQYDKSQIPTAEALRFGIVVSQWNNHITHNLQKGAIEALVDLGANPNDISTFKVPGSFELIYGANQICKRGEVDAVIVIGSVIRGATAHFDYVCQGVTQGIKDLNIKYDIPVIFCVLTDDNEQQSIDRSGGIHGNKGTEAGVTAVIMANFNKQN